MKNKDVRKLLDAVFRNLALVLGGIFAVHGVGDGAVRQIMKHLYIVRETAMSKLEGMRTGIGKPRQSGHPDEHHPMVATFPLKFKRCRYLFGREHDA